MALAQTAHGTDVSSEFSLWSLSSAHSEQNFLHVHDCAFYKVELSYYIITHTHTHTHTHTNLEQANKLKV